MNKEHNFISAVVYVSGEPAQTAQFLRTLNGSLDAHFLQYEIIAVNALGSRSNADALRECAKEIDKPLTVVNMAAGQPHEQCMNAGLDIAIGDYVYEFDSAELTYPPEMVYRAYETAMQGNDIVTVCPEREKRSSRLFYSLFNRHSGAANRLRTDVFRLVSRRALNRVHAINENLPYRKAAYAACGLKAEELEFVGGTGTQATKAEHPTELAVDSLILYTNFGYRFGLGLSLLMLAGTIMMVIYTAVTYFIGNPINGWTTTMLALTAGLTGLFAILTVVLKYLTLILQLLFQKQKYLVESIEKL